MVLHILRGRLIYRCTDTSFSSCFLIKDRGGKVSFLLKFPGITILFTKPTAKDPNLFSFLSPLSLGVWIYMATAYLAVSILLYVLARFLS